MTPIIATPTENEPILAGLSYEITGNPHLEIFCKSAVRLARRMDSHIDPLHEKLRAVMEWAGYNFEMARQLPEQSRENLQDTTLLLAWRLEAIARGAQAELEDAARRCAVCGAVSPAETKWGRRFCDTQCIREWEEDHQ